MGTSEASEVDGWSRELPRHRVDETWLREIAALVTKPGSAEEVFAIVAAQASRQLDGQAVTLSRFEGQNSLLVIATYDGPAPPRTRIEYGARTLPDRVRSDGAVVRIDDYSSEPDAGLAVRFGLRASVAVPVTIEGRVWGMLTATSPTEALPPYTESRLVDFAQLVASAIASIDARAELRAMAEHDARMRAIAEESAVSDSVELALQMAADYAASLPEVRSVSLSAFEVGLFVTAAAPAPDQDEAQEEVDLPLHIRERPWGVMTVRGTAAALRDASIDRLTDLAAVVERVVSAIVTRRHLRELADERAALRRIVELIARAESLPVVLASVAIEASRLLGRGTTVLLRFESDVATVVAAEAPGSGTAVAIGAELPVTDGTPFGDLCRLQRSVDLGPDERLVRALFGDPVAAGVAVPIAVEGAVWGALACALPVGGMPFDTESRLGAFAHLAGAAIASAQNHDGLTASRARIITAADDARRRLQRDVHDGAQQRLVHTILALKLARDEVRAGRRGIELIEEALTNAEAANRQLRDVVRGILPAALSRRGLVAGITSLVADLPVPVELDLSVPRLPAMLETTAYFTVAEAITNSVKHARAQQISVHGQLSESGDELLVEIRDDGIGGAEPSRGSGLVGLADRIEASHGTMTIVSPRGLGTTISLRLPTGTPTTDPPSRRPAGD